MRDTANSRLCHFGAIALLLIVTSVLRAGSLTPPGAPAPTMKPLTDVEPRTAIRQADIPLTITTPGSYYLAENLTFGSLGNAITMESSGVSIDLNGYTITGPGQLIGGTSVGISTGTLGLYRGQRVHNGTIREFAQYGIFVAQNSLVERMTVVHCGDSGIIALTGSTVRNCNASFNGKAAGNGRGITVTDQCLVEDNLCVSNGNFDGTQAGANGFGIDLSASSVARRNVVRNTRGGTSSGTARGISTGTSCVVEGNEISGTIAPAGASVGIALGASCRAVRNVISDTSSTPSSAIGITANSKGEVIDNVIHGSASTTGSAGGISMGADSIAIGNAVGDISAGAAGPSAQGIAAGSGGDVVRNVIRVVRCTSAGTAQGISAINGSIRDNLIDSIFTTGAGSAVGIQVGGSATRCMVDGNTIGGLSGGTTFTGINVQGANVMVLNNRITDATTAGVFFAAGSTGGYAAGNLSRVGGFVDIPNMNNEAGTNPAPNLVW